MILRCELLLAIQCSLQVTLVVAHRDTQRLDSLEDVQLDVELASSSSVEEKQPPLQAALAVSAGVLASTFEATAAMTTAAVGGLGDAGLAQVANSSRQLPSTGQDHRSSGSQHGADVDGGHHQKSPSHSSSHVGAPAASPSSKLEHFVAVEVDSQASHSITHHYRPVSSAVEQLSSHADGEANQTQGKHRDSSDEAARSTAADLANQRHQPVEQHDQHHSQQQQHQQEHQQKHQRHSRHQVPTVPEPEPQMSLADVSAPSPNPVALPRCEKGLPNIQPPQPQGAAAPPATPPLPGPVGTDPPDKYGCASVCSCSWSEQCYPWFAQNANGSSPVNVGVCGDAVVMMILYSCLMFSIALFLVVTLRFALAPKPCY